MMAFLLDYGLFLAKAVTVVVAIAVVLGLIVGAASKNKGTQTSSVKVKKVNDYFKDMSDSLLEAISSSDHLKQVKKTAKKDEKAVKKATKKGDKGTKSRVFLLDFDGDMKASAVDQLREEITAVLSQAKDTDEVVVRLESGGGMVHSYGLAASQLDRIRAQGVPLTVCVDKVAASGGYMMACVADKILAAPFAMIGSIGVVAQMPNIHRLLKKHDVDVELHTAGEHKRTLTLLGENTEEGRKKFIEDLQEIHLQFKDFVKSHRPSVNIDEIADGQVWLGTKALEMKLVDELQTSDSYLVALSKVTDIYQVSIEKPKSLQEKLGLSIESHVDSLLVRWWQRLFNQRHIG